MIFQNIMIKTLDIRIQFKALYHIWSISVFFVIPMIED